MAKAKKKAAPKKRADHYEPKVKTDLSFDELIAMSVGKKNNIKNMEGKNFQRYYGEDRSISIQYAIDFDGNQTHINGITLFCNFDCGLPIHPILKNTESGWRFVANDGTIVDNEFSRDIIKEIIKRKEQETPKFEGG
jgi:hypothetical protein